MSDFTSSTKGVCRNCGIPIKTEETVAHGPKGISHHYYKHCLQAMKSALEEAGRRIERYDKTLTEIAGLDKGRTQNKAVMLARRVLVSELLGGSSND